MGQLSQAVKAKYPQYANVPDDVLEQKVLQRYPQYGRIAQPQKSVSGFIENVGKSGVQAVKDIAGAAINTLNPDIEKNTIANLAKLGIDTAKLMGGDKSELNRASQVLSFYKQRYGGVDNVGETIYNDPVGFLLDASSVLGGAGAIAKGVGAVSKVGGITRAGNALSTASRVADPLQAVTSMAGRSGGRVNKAVQNFGRKLEDAGDTAVTRGIGNPAKQATLAQKAGRSVSSFIDDYDLYDRSPETAGNIKRDIIGRYDDIAMNSGNQVQVGQIITSLDDTIANLQKGVGGVMSDSDIAKIGELQRRKEQLLQAIGATDTATPLYAGTDTLTNFRRKVIDPDIPQSMFGLDPSGSGKAQGAKTMRDYLRKTINSTDPQLERLGLDYGMAKGLEDILTKSDARAANRQMFNFTKLGSAGVGSVIAGAPGVVGGFAFEQLVNSPKFIKAASKSMKSTGKKLQKSKGVSVPKGVGDAYNVFKTVRLANPDPTESISPNTQIEPQSMPKAESYDGNYTPPATTLKYPKKIPAYGKVKSAPKSDMTNVFRKEKKLTKGSFY